MTANCSATHKAVRDFSLLLFLASLIVIAFGIVYFIITKQNCFIVAGILLLIASISSFVPLGNGGD